MTKAPSRIEQRFFEFYLHNLSLTYLNVWHPNLKLEDLQLMAMASWMSHEEAKATKIKRVLAREEEEPLFISEK